MDRLESMSVLLAVIDAGSLSAAGRRLGMPLPTVSRKVSELESHLRSRLLIRSPRGFTLTDAGRSYIAACRSILDDIDEAERAAAGEYSQPRGELVLTAPIVFGRLHVLPILIEFLQAYPEVSVRLILGDRLVNLAEGHVDLALRIGTLPDSGLVATRLGTIRRIVCASPGYLAARGIPREPRDIDAHRCVGFENLAAGDAWQFLVAGVETLVPVHPRLIVNTAEAAIDAAIAGAGLTCVLSYQVESALRAGALSLVLRKFEPAPMPVNFLYPGRGRMPLKLRALLDFAAPRLRLRLKESEVALASSSGAASARRPLRSPRQRARRERTTSVKA